MTKPFDPSKPCTTRDCRPVRILCTDAKGAQPICALVTDKNGREYARHFRLDGGYMHHGEHGTEDLINVPTKRKGWIGMRKAHGSRASFATTNIYDTEDLANQATDTVDQWSIIEIEFDE
jgi:hypothetical protein